MDISHQILKTEKILKIKEPCMFIVQIDHQRMHTNIIVLFNFDIRESMHIQIVPCLHQIKPHYCYHWVQSRDQYLTNYLANWVKNSALRLSALQLFGDDQTLANFRIVIYATCLPIDMPLPYTLNLPLVGAPRAPRKGSVSLDKEQLQVVCTMYGDSQIQLDSLLRTMHVCFGEDLGQQSFCFSIDVCSRKRILARS